MRLILFLLLPLLSISAYGQALGGPCEGCEALLEYGQKKLTSTDTLPGFKDHDNKMLITGTVYQIDGSTPASNIIIYIYHTNEKGIYPTKGNEQGWARRHGYLRGWVKTDENGKFYFYTFKPASYPSRTEPAHVHITVKEPNKTEYWLDSYQFDDDPLLTNKVRNSMANRGGSGIVQLFLQNGLLLCQRDITLGKNIPNYK